MVVVCFQLEELGIASQHVTWARVTMTSDAHICVRYEGKDHSTKFHNVEMQKQLMIMSLHRNGFLFKTWPMSPESAKVSPPRKAACPEEQPWIAIKSKGWSDNFLDAASVRNSVCRSHRPSV